MLEEEVDAIREESQKNEMVFNEKLERLQNGLEEKKQELKDFRA